ncbi:MAG: hypothetical protein OXT69_08075 [Candidatus Poribacteria bacterium]|nr:hypothetical protein [Candidatus Poribacteria bacterium]
MFTRSYRRLIVFAVVCFAALPAVLNAQQSGMQVTERGDDGKADKITLDFVNIELKDLIQFIQRETDLTIISTERDIQGKKLSLVNLKNVTIEEAMEKIKTGLMQFDLTTIHTDSTLLITTVQKAVRMKVPVSYGADPESIPDSDQVITHVIPLKHLSADEISGKISPLKSDAGVLFGDRESNTIVITGIASNIRRIATFLAQIDVASMDIQLFETEVIQINNTEVDEIEDALEDLFGRSGDTARWFYSDTGGSAASAGLAVFITSNDETNQLIVRATKENMDYVKELVAKMDVAPSLQTEVRVFPLKYANASDVVDILEDVLEGSSSSSRSSSRYYYSSWYDRSRSSDSQGIAGEIQYAADERRNAVVISSDPSNWSIIETLINELDIQDDPGKELEVFVLKNANAEALVENIQELIDGQDDDDRDRYRYWWYDDYDQGDDDSGAGFGLQGGVNLTAVTRLNAIVAATSSKNLEVLRNLIDRMDVSMPEQEWGTRIFPLHYADATKIAEVLNSVYQGGGQQGGRSSGGFFSFLESVRSRNQGNTAQGSLAGNVVAAAYPTTNSIIISTGTARNFQLIEEFIKELDVPTPEGQREITRVFNLEYSDATQLEPLLTQIWSSSSQNQGGGGGFPFFGGFGRFSQPAPEQNTDINSLIDKVSLFADEQTNSLVVTTRFRYIEDIEKIVRELDIVRGQVWIEIEILELTLDDTMKMGIELELMERRLFGTDAFGKNREPGSNPLTGEFSSSLNLNQEITGFSVQAATNEYLGFLHTLMRSNKVRTLSSPRFMVRDNQTATFVSGRDIPYLQSARTSDLLEGQIFDFDFLQDIGININITPRIARITAGERGKRTIGLQIDQITASNFIEFTNFNAPLTEESTVSTFIDAEDGQQIVIGGLKKRKQQEVEEKVPVLGDLPLIGALFRRTENVAQDSEVVIVITPHIVDINNAEDKARIQDIQYEQFDSHEGVLKPRGEDAEPMSEETEAPMSE